MFTCPYCGGKAIDEPGNDALVCTSCGRLFDLDAAADEEREAAETEKRVLGELMAEQDALEKRIRRFRSILWGIVVVLSLAVICVCIVKYVSSSNPYEGYTSDRADVMTVLNEEVLSEDYKEFYGASSSAKKELVLISSVLIVTFVVIGLFLSSLVPARMRKTVLGEDEKGNVVVVFIISFFLVLISIFNVAIYMGKKKISPSKAEYRLYVIDYRGKESKLADYGTDYATEYVYYIRFMKDGKEHSKRVSGDEYNFFPKDKGKYYIGAASDGSSHINFRVYPADKYIPQVTTVDYE